jgi:hypothetical protein
MLLRNEIFSWKLSHDFCYTGVQAALHRARSLDIPALLKLMKRTGSPKASHSAILTCSVDDQGANRASWARIMPRYSLRRFVAAIALISVGMAIFLIGFESNVPLWASLPAATAACWIFGGAMIGAAISAPFAREKLAAIIGFAASGVLTTLAQYALWGLFDSGRIIYPHARLPVPLFWTTIDSVGRICAPKRTHLCPSSFQIRPSFTASLPASRRQNWGFLYEKIVLRAACQNSPLRRRRHRA